MRKVLHGLTPRERWEFKRQLLIPVKEGADPAGLAILFGPFAMYWAVLLFLSRPAGYVQLALWLLPWALLFAMGWQLLDRRLLRSHLSRVRCPACGGRFIESRPGGMRCAEGHWTDVQLIWPARHPPPPLNWKLGFLWVRSAQEFRRYPELKGFDEGEARILLDQAKTWEAASIGRAGMIAMVVGFSLGFVTFGTIVAVLLTVASGFGLRGPRHDWVVIVAVSASSVLGAFAGLASARAVTMAALRRAVRKRMSTSTCGQCDYSLKEIPPVPGGVRCPECGAFTPFPPGA